jgi:DNA-directed RNA polymerase II subunit RPB2
MDKTALVLNYGEVPLVKTRYMKYLNGEENPWRKRHGRYNVYGRYSILFNEGRWKEGCSGRVIFPELHEETNNSSEVTIETVEI